MEDVFRVLILELPQNDISQLRDASEIDLDGVALSNLDEDFSEIVDEDSLFLVIFVEEDDFSSVLPASIAALLCHSFLPLVLIKGRIVLGRWVGSRAKLLKPGEYNAECCCILGQEGSADFIWLSAH